MRVILLLNLTAKEGEKTGNLKEIYSSLLPLYLLPVERLSMEPTSNGAEKEDPSGNPLCDGSGDGGLQKTRTVLANKTLREWESHLHYVREI